MSDESIGWLLMSCLAVGVASFVACNQPPPPPANLPLAMTCDTVGKPGPYNLVYRCENKETICYVLEDGLSCVWKEMPQ